MKGERVPNFPDTVYYVSRSPGMPLYQCFAMIMTILSVVLNIHRFYILCTSKKVFVDRHNAVKHYMFSL